MRPCWTKLAFQIGNGVHYAEAYFKAFLVGTFIYLQALTTRLIELANDRIAEPERPEEPTENLQAEVSTVPWKTHPGVHRAYA
jgi:hypothetical protein